jgi:hypothetical protein
MTAGRSTARLRAKLPTRKPQASPETQVNRLDPPPSRPDFVNSLSQEMTSNLLLAIRSLLAQDLLDPGDRLVDRLLRGDALGNDAVDGLAPDVLLPDPARPPFVVAYADIIELLRLGSRSDLSARTRRPSRRTIRTRQGARHPSRRI